MTAFSRLNRADQIGLSLLTFFLFLALQWFAALRLGQLSGLDGVPLRRRVHAPPTPRGNAHG